MFNFFRVELVCTLGPLLVFWRALAFELMSHLPVLAHADLAAVNVLRDLFYLLLITPFFVINKPCHIWRASMARDKLSFIVLLL